MVTGEKARYFVYHKNLKQIPKSAPDPTKLGKAADQMLQLKTHAVCVCGLKKNKDARIIIDITAAQYGHHARDVPGVPYPCAIFENGQMQPFAQAPQAPRRGSSLSVDEDLWMLELRAMWKQEKTEADGMFTLITDKAESKVAKYLAPAPVVFI